MITTNKIAPMLPKKQLIFFEGNEGSGKTFLLNALAMQLRGSNCHVHLTGAWTPNTTLTARIRKFLLTDGKSTDSALLDATLILAAISSNIHDSVFTAFENGFDIVLMDRGYISFIVRQFYLGPPEVMEILSPTLERHIAELTAGLERLNVHATYCHILNSPANCLENLKKRNSANHYNLKYMQDMVKVDSATVDAFSQMNASQNSKIFRFENFTAINPFAPVEAYTSFFERLIIK